MEECSLSYYVKEADHTQSKTNGFNPSELISKPSINQNIAPSLKIACDNNVSNFEDIFVCDDDLIELFSDKSSWLLSDANGGSSNLLPLDDDEDVESSNKVAAGVSAILRSLNERTHRYLPITISTNTYVRPKKSRSNSAQVTPTQDVGGVKLRRRLTTTIDPSPNLIPHLHHLSKTNNRPLSNCEDLDWEDGAADEHAKVDGDGDHEFDETPHRPAVSASLLKRLQELKATNSVRTPFSSRPVGGIVNNFPADTMSTSHLLREIPDVGEEPESFLSLGGASQLSIGDVEDQRFTFGGIQLPRGKTLLDCMDKFLINDAPLEENEQNSTFIKNEDLNPYITNPLYHAERHDSDENRNMDALKIAQNFNSQPVTKILNQTFPKCFDQSIQLNNDQDKLNDSYNNLGKKSTSPFLFKEQIIEQVSYQQSTITQTDRIVEDIKTQLSKSREELNDGQTYKYCTATYSRPTARSVNSPARSGLPMRRTSSGRLSSEDLTRSPARSDGTVTPVDLRPGIGTYTRNSPVERCNSEDEQMSTTSDHSGKSQDSIEDLSDRCKITQPTGRKVSTPRVSAAAPGFDDWHTSMLSPINMSPASSKENLGSAIRVINKIPHGPVPIKPALIRPTENFKRPVKKDQEVIAPTSGRAPMKAGVLKTPTSGLPKPTVRALPTRISAGRLSSIPRPPSSRLQTTTKDNC